MNGMPRPVVMGICSAPRAEIRSAIEGTLFGSDIRGIHHESGLAN